MAWPKRLSIDKRIIVHLSASTYENFPRALRELVSNAYDADATRVNIEIDEHANTITIADNGVGMTPDEFDFFLRIAGKQRTKKRVTALGRKRIGQFGIGFLAMFPFCKTVEIESTAEGSPILFKARIPVQRFTSSDSVINDITAVDINGREINNSKYTSQHYTVFKLIDTNELITRYLYPKEDKQKKKTRVNSVRSLRGMKKLSWELQDILPLNFRKGSLIQAAVYPEEHNFTVTVNNAPLVANEFCSELLATSNNVEQIGNVRFRYAIGTSWKSIKPDEARGLRVRLNRVGVGPRTFFDLNVMGRTFSRLHWLSGEVNIISGLDEFVTLDRDSFTASEDYEEFRDYFRSKIRSIAAHIEDVDEALRKITAQTTQSPRAQTASKSEVIANQVRRLEKRGFNVVVDDDKTSTSSSVQVDVKHKTVRLNKPLVDSGDYIEVGGRAWRMKYDTWDVNKSNNSACRIEGKTVILNKNFPLFTGAHKDIFRRLMIILTYAELRANTKRELAKVIHELVYKEFVKRK